MRYCGVEVEKEGGSEGVREREKERERKREREREREREGEREKERGYSVICEMGRKTVIAKMTVA